MEGYERLCVAVVERAALDYKAALLRLYRNPHDLAAQKMICDCELFFRNEMSMYADLDGETIIRKIRQQVEKQVRR